MGTLINNSLVAENSHFIVDQINPIVSVIPAPAIINMGRSHVQWHIKRANDGYRNANALGWLDLKTLCILSLES